MSPTLVQEAGPTKISTLATSRGQNTKVPEKEKKESILRQGRIAGHQAPKEEEKKR
ncbi:MAG: hypothetical protein ACREBR_03385 [bacterium]